MAMLAQLKADEEAGLVEPTEWTVVEPDEPRPDWVPPATPPDVREKARRPRGRARLGAAIHSPRGGDGGGRVTTLGRWRICRSS